MIRLFHNGYVDANHIKPEPHWDDICNFVSYVGHCVSKRPCKAHMIPEWEIKDEWLLCSLCAWEEDVRHRRETV